MAQGKGYKASAKEVGFTLIELLVAIIMAALIIAPILGLMVNILQTDRKEQAKAASEQELQSAADYIARDLQQAVYIYDAQGLNEIKDELKPLPANHVPVLVFWKRKIIHNAISEDLSSKCITNCNDAFVYALVAYYLVNDGGDNGTWSNAARITRFEIQDGVRDADGIYVDPTDDKIGRDKGFVFKLTELQGDTLRERMENWENSGEAYTKSPLVLIDYIDQSTAGNFPKEDCPADSDPTVDPEWQKVPSNPSTYSFYACVYSSKNTAKVFLRGNAYARIENQDNQYKESRAAFYPTAKIEVTGSGGLTNTFSNN